MCSCEPRLLRALELVQHEVIRPGHRLPHIQPVTREEVLIRTLQPRTSQVSLHPCLVAGGERPDRKARIPQLLPRLLDPGPRLEPLVRVGADVGVLLAEQLAGLGDADLAQHAVEERPEDGEEGLVPAREVEEGELALGTLHPREGEDLGGDAVRAEAVADPRVDGLEEGLVADACADDVEDDVLSTGSHGCVGGDVREL